MTGEGRISLVLTPEDKGTIFGALDSLRAKIPKVEISPNDIDGLPTIGTVRSGMVDTFTDQMRAHPELMPGFVSLSELEKDFQLRADLTEIMARLREQVEILDVAIRVTNADIYGAFLDFYANVQVAAKRGVAGADAVVADLGRFFSRNRSSSPAPTNPPANP